MAKSWSFHAKNAIFKYKMYLTFVLMFYWIYQTLCEQSDKMIGKPRILSFFPNLLKNSINHGHSCEILYIFTGHMRRIGDICHHFFSLFHFYGILYCLTKETSVQGQDLLKIISLTVCICWIYSAQQMRPCFLRYLIIWSEWILIHCRT